jgi:hypothetical protein
VVRSIDSVLASAVVASLSAAPCGLAAQDAPLAIARLEWAGGGTPCAPLELADRVEALLGRQALTSDGQPSDLVVRWRVDADAGVTWTARFDLERPDGSHIGGRVVDASGPRCTAVHETLATVLAVAIDVPRRELEIHAPVAAPEAPRPTARTGGEVSGRVAIGGVGALGWLPGLAVGVSALASIEPDRDWSLRLGGEVWGEGRVESPSASARVQLWTVHGGVCVRAWREGPLLLDACAGAFVGAARAVGENLDVMRDVSSVIVGGDVGAQLDWLVIGPVGLRLELRARVPMVLAQVVYVSSGMVVTLAEVSPVVALLGISAFVYLGS